MRSNTFLLFLKTKSPWFLEEHHSIRKKDPAVSYAHWSVEINLQGDKLETLSICRKSTDVAG